MQLITRIIDRGKWIGNSVVVKDYFYTYKGKSYYIPHGFVTDFRSFFIRDLLLNKASVPHDWHYWKQDVTKFHADWKYAIMVYETYKNQTNKAHAFLVATREYLGVSIFGWCAWLQNKYLRHKYGGSYKMLYHRNLIWKKIKL